MSILFSSPSEVRFIDRLDNDYVKVFMAREDEGLDILHPNYSDLFNEITLADRYSFTVGRYIPRDTMIDEAVAIKIPKAYSLNKTSVRPTFSTIDSTEHFTIWLNEQPTPTHDNTIDCWVWIELTEVQDGVKYVPIILHSEGTGVSIHPDFRKYFLRSFDKKERHVILGFCYIYGGMMISQCTNYSHKNRKLTEKDIEWIERYALDYKDTDAPKRIDMGSHPSSSKAIELDFKHWD